MSGGVQDVRVEDLTAINTESAVRIKSAVGR
ncbi:putative polygalacturonase-like, partial [Trifolium medium]|nr:putative polygalacturonase-like [Trifolium medium]